MKHKNKRHKKLRSGFTTGTAAAAATKAAAMVLLGLDVPASVDIRLLTDEIRPIDIHVCRVHATFVACTVIKDAGDDPDVTNRAEIGARVKRTNTHSGVMITGGEGVGTVTKPGLEIPPGQPAINPGPRRMINEAISDVKKATGIDSGFDVEIFVPNGEAIARRTLNERLGIIGGISILGTTGVVTPLSHDAYVATIRSALSVACASGIKTVVCTTGRRSERHAQALFPDLPPEAFVQIGDHFKKSMKLAADACVNRVILAAFFGKAIKMANGAPHTHAAKSRLALEELADWVLASGGSKELAQRVSNTNTAREAFFILEHALPVVFTNITRKMVDYACRFGAGKIDSWAVLFDYNGNVAADSVNIKERK